MHRLPLPATLADAPFSVAQAHADGVGRGRLRNPELHTPFHGVRCAEPPGSAYELAHAYQPRLKSHVLIAGPSAAQIYGLPLPTRLGHPDTLHLAVRKSDCVPYGVGVTTRIVSSQAYAVHEFRELRLTSPELTWCMLARECSVPELVKLADAIISQYAYVGRDPGFPIGTRGALEIAVHRWMGCIGVRKLREALPLVRERVASPPETDLRLLLWAEGFDDLEVNADLHDETGTFVARVDLLDRRLRLAFEYDGDGHRTSKDVYQRDLHRNDDLDAIDHLVVHVVADDLYGHRADLIDRVRRARERALRRLG